jgi:predicted GNAT family N-acyltransferase
MLNLERERTEVDWGNTWAGHTVGGLALRLARTQAELECLQRLRFQVFTQEMNAVFPDQHNGLDIDRFDPWCEHFMVTEPEENRVVGTYRLLTPENANKAGGYYSESEFDISALDALRPSLVEVGRSCIHPDYRNGSAIMMLWGGIAADGVITEERMSNAILTARRELEGITRQYRKTGWQEAYGSSGTAKGLVAILQENGMSKKGITLEGMELLRKRLVHDGKVDMRNLSGIKPHRAPVLAAGLAIMMAAFQELKIRQMLPGEGALRVGVLYDMLGRESEHDQRDQTVQQMMKRYQVDTRQSHRVHDAAMQFFAQLKLPDTPEVQELQRQLGWAADLHEVGLSIAHADYHKHTAYVLEHADMPGFSNDDQMLLSFLSLGHQGKLGKLKRFETNNAWWLTLLSLRLAVMLMRRREDRETLPLSLQARGKTVQIHLDHEWMASHPLSQASLLAEVQAWQSDINDLSLELV